MTKHSTKSFLGFLLILAGFVYAGDKQLSLKEYTDKLTGGWVGQMFGVEWGIITEFEYCDIIIPVDKVPDYAKSWIAVINNAYKNDDLYVEIPFFQAMDERGITATWHDFGEYFAKYNFTIIDPTMPGGISLELWHANLAGYTNLNKGIPTPSSGHYSSNKHCDDIDWQIECDFIGQITPGQLQSAIDIAWRAGHTMNYGDGVYGGVFISAMHAASFFATSVMEIVDQGRLSLPIGSQYRQIIDDVIAWYNENPSSWETTWQKIQNKWGDQDRCPTFSGAPCNIDAKINGAYVAVGLLYGNGNMENSMRIAMRCGHDSDCNPSSVGGIMGNWIGYEKLPARFKERLDTKLTFLGSNYSLHQNGDRRGVLESSVKMARQIVLRNGGLVQGAGDGEMWLIPDQGAVMPPILEKWPTSTNAKPQLAASVASQEGNTITFSALATDGDGIKDYQWFFGDLSYANGAAVSHAYRYGGTYKVICYVTDTIGNTAFQELEVTVSNDSTRPNAPKNLTSTGQTETGVTLSWQAPDAAADGDVASSYQVMRDGVMVGTLQSTTFTDSGLQESTGYQYQIFAVDDASNISLSAAQGSYSTRADQTAPNVASVTALSASQVRVVFNEKVEKTSAETAANFKVDQGISVQSASFLSDGITVNLSTSTLSSGSFLLTIQGVKDQSKTGNIMAPVSKGFNYNMQLMISSISAASGRKYISSYIKVGDTFYIDREVKIKEIPAAYQNMLWIKTANDDKNVSTPSGFLQYTINQEASVYVGYDTRLSPPSWLSTWSATNDIIKNDDVEGKNNYRLYRRDFVKGTVTLGPNTTSQTSSNMYIVLNSTQGIDPPIVEVFAPVISAVQAGNIQMTSATISWLTDEGASSKVEYGTTTAYGSSTALDDNMVTSHGMTLTGLAAETIHHYRVSSKDTAGNESVSADYTFKTLQTTQNPVAEFALHTSTMQIMPGDDNSPEPPGAGGDVDQLIRLHKEMGFKWDRCTIGWGSVEYPKGVYHWEKIDERLNKLFAAGFNVSIIVYGGNNYDGTIYWDAKVPGLDGLKGTRAEYVEFVKKVVERYDGDGVGDGPINGVVKWWEGWNEPLNFAKITIQQAVDLFNDYYRACKSADPNCKVITSAFAWWDHEGVQLYEYLIKNAVGFDMLNVHSSYAQLTTANPEESVYNGTNNMNNSFLTYGLGNRPWWISEFGIIGRGWESMDSRLYSLRIARMYVTYRHQILQTNLAAASHWYGAGSTMSLIDWQKWELKPAGKAGKTYLSFFQNEDVVSSERTVGGTAYRMYKFGRKNGSNIFAVWAMEGQKTSVTLTIQTPQVRKTNLMGDQVEILTILNGKLLVNLTEEPIYIEEIADTMPPAPPQGVSVSKY